MSTTHINRTHDAYNAATGGFIGADWEHEYMPPCDAPEHGVYEPCPACGHGNPDDMCDGGRDCQVCADARHDATACEEHAADALAAAKRGDWAAALTLARAAKDIEDKWGDAPTWGPLVKAVAFDAAEAVGRECAYEAIEAGGPDPTDCEGGCLLPSLPVGGDWEKLDLLLEDNSDDVQVFSEAYEDVMGPAIERVKAGRANVQVTEVVGDTDLYCNGYDNNDSPQPVVVELNCDDGELSADYLVDPSSTRADVWHGRRLQWGIQLMLADTANILLHKIAPLAQQILDGYEPIWNGSNHVGRLNGSARTASEEIERMCEAAVPDLLIYTASDWFSSSTPADIGVTADSTDDDLEEVAANALAYADGEVHVITGAEEYLQEMRDEIWDERDAEREERWEAIDEAADDGGIIQAADMVPLFPGQPTMHTTTDVRSALRAAGAPADYRPDGWTDPIGAAD